MNHYQDPDADDDYPPDPPTTREVVPHPMEHVARTAMRDPDFLAALKDSQSDVATVKLRGMARMFALTFEAGEGVPAFYELPQHLPPDEGGQRMLLASKASADADLREQLITWARRNGQAAAPAAQTLANAVDVYRQGEAELARARQAAAAIEPARQALADAQAAAAAAELAAAELDEEAIDALEKAQALVKACEARLAVAIERSTPDPQLRSSLSTIAGWCMSQWRVSISSAPADGVPAWAAELVGRWNPTPPDLLGGGSPRVFVPHVPRDGGAHNPFGGGR